MEQRTVLLPRMAGIRAYEQNNGIGLPPVLARFMVSMFGQGGYKARKAEARENVYEWDTELCHYEVMVESDIEAWVKAWPKAPRAAQNRVRYDRREPTAMWKIGLYEGEGEAAHG